MYNFMMQVGWVDYINALPLTLPFQMGKIACDAQFVYAIPSKLNQLLREHQLDIALTSSIEYLQAGHEMIPGYGIASQECILSVNLYTQVPISSLSGMRVGLTHHSASSALLLKILCFYLWKIEPQFEPLSRKEPFSNYAAFLLIGDEALMHHSIPHFQTIDLASAWYALTALPFVFALFSCQKVSQESKTCFAKKMEEALRWSAFHRDFVEEEACKRSNLPQALVHKYFDVLQHRLGKKEMDGLECFNKLKTEFAYVPSFST